MKLIDKTKQDIEEVLDEYFDKKQRYYDYGNDMALKSQVEHYLTMAKNYIFATLEELDENIDSDLTIPNDRSSMQEMFDDMDYRQSQLAEERR